MAERGLHLMRDDAALPVRHAVNVDPTQRVRDADVSGLREKRSRVDESPDRKERVHAAGVVVVAEDS
jgi:hypothetical protein